MAHTECEDLSFLYGYSTTDTQQTKKEIIEEVNELITRKFADLPDPEKHREKIDGILSFIKKELRDY